MASGCAMRPMTVQVPSREVLARAVNPDERDPVTGKRLYGGTNRLMAGQGKACTDYDEVITEFGWFGALGGAKDRGRAKAQQKATRETVDPVTGKKLFGGTNTLMAGIGKAVTAYDEPIQAFGWFGALGGRRDTSQVQKT